MTEGLGEPALQALARFCRASAQVCLDLERPALASPFVDTLELVGVMLGEPSLQAEARRFHGRIKYGLATVVVIDSPWYRRPRDKSASTLWLLEESVTDYKDALALRSNDDWYGSGNDIRHLSASFWVHPDPAYRSAAEESLDEAKAWFASEGARAGGPHAAGNLQIDLARRDLRVARAERFAGRTERYEAAEHRFEVVEDAGWKIQSDLMVFEAMAGRAEMYAAIEGSKGECDRDYSVAALLVWPHSPNLGPFKRAEHLARRLGVTADGVSTAIRAGRPPVATIVQSRGFDKRRITRLEEHLRSTGRP